MFVNNSISKLSFSIQTCEPLKEGYKPLLFCDLLWLCLKFFASWTNQEMGKS